MIESPAFFGLLAVTLVGSSLAVVLTKNLFHSVLWLALALVGTAGVFLSLSAEFLAAVQVLLYTGGLLTVVVFAIVVTERLVGERLAQVSLGLRRAALAAVLLLAPIGWIVGRMPPGRPAPEAPPDLTRLIGDALLTRFVLPFELLALLLLTVLVGAVYLARPED